MSSSASVIGFPLFRVSSSASSLERARTIAASLKSTWPRSCGVARFQSPLSNARRAAHTAVSTSAAVASGTRAIAAPVAGSTTSRGLVTAGPYHQQSRRSWSFHKNTTTEDTGDTDDTTRGTRI